MAECAYCKAEVNLYVNGKPICLQCEGSREHLRNSARVARNNSLRQRVLRKKIREWVSSIEQLIPPGGIFRAG